MWFEKTKKHQAKKLNSSVCHRALHGTEEGGANGRGSDTGIWEAVEGKWAGGMKEWMNTLHTLWSLLPVGELRVYLFKLLGLKKEFILILSFFNLSARSELCGNVCCCNQVILYLFSLAADWRDRGEYKGQVRGSRGRKIPGVSASKQKDIQAVWGQIRAVKLVR